MRLRSAILAIVAIGLAAAPAQAITTNKRELKVTLTSKKANTPTGMILRLITSAAELAPDSGAHDDILMPRGMAYNGAALPSCDPDKLVAQGPSGCPSKSIIGSGRIVALVRPTCVNPGVAGLTGDLRPIVDLTVVNADRGRKMLAYLKNPIIGATYIDIRMGRAANPFGLKFTFDVPDPLLQPLDGVCISLADVQLNIKNKTVTVRRVVRGRTRITHPGVIQNGACPRNRIWRFRNDVSLVSGQKVPGTNTVSRVPTQKTSGATTVTCRA